MGTNYYALENPCSECGKPKDGRLHLGKSSAGWKFTFRKQDEYSNFQQFKEFIQSDRVRIEDEYGREISAEELVEKIKSKEDGRSHMENAQEDKWGRPEDIQVVDGHEFINHEFC